MGAAFNFFFGTKTEEKPKLSKEEIAIFDCKKCKDNIKSYIKKLERNSLNQKILAKECLKQNNREKAKRYLSMSKFYATKTEESNNMLFAIEEQLTLIETTKNQQQIFAVLEEGNKVLKILQKDVNAERMQEISDDLEDLKGNQKEITDFFSNRGVNSEVFNGELEKDIEQLMKTDNSEISELEKNLPNVVNKSIRENVIKKKVSEDEYVFV